MVDNFSNSGMGQILVEKINKKNVTHYGIVDLKNKRPKLTSPIQIFNVIEKPSLKNAPSNFRIVGRYIFPYQIMNHLDTLSIIIPKIINTILKDTMFLKILGITKMEE